MRIKFIIFFLSFTSVKAQFFNLPNEYFFSLLTEKELAFKDSKIHTGIKPYVHFFSNKYCNEPDSLIFSQNRNIKSINSRLFFKHLIEINSSKEKYKLIVDPILNLELGQDFIDTTNSLYYTNTRGIIASGSIGEKVYFESIFIENQSTFPTYISNYARLTTIIPGQGRWKSYNTNGFDYALSSGFVSVQPIKSLNIQIGHGKQKIGNGYRSLFLSDNSFNYPFARFTKQFFKNKVQYTTIYSLLMNLVPASKFINPNTERLFQTKAASFQYLSINANKFLNIAFFQGMIWQSTGDKNKQNIDINYFNPLIFANLFKYQLNNKNNILIGVETKIKITNKLNTYGQLLVDNWNDTSKVKSANAYQLGINYYDALGLKNFFVQIEYNNVGETCYSNPTPLASNQSYSHYNQNLAFTPGSNEELILISDYKWKRFFVNVKYNYQTKILNNEKYSFTSILNSKIGYIINPSYNLNISLGVNLRSQNFCKFEAMNNETNYIYLGLKTNLYNLYYDF